MASRTPWPLSEIETSSADLAPPVRRRLGWWVEHPGEHARFLNTLALMEHIGSRKIMVSQTRGPLSQEILKHLAEETRHSYFFKRAAETLARRPLEFDDTDALRPTSAKMYFGRLDAAITDALEPDVHPEVPYLYVSLTIELRAIWTYRLYQQALSEHGGTLSLKSVLAEEEMHLAQMVERLQELGAEPDVRVTGFARIEDRLFRGFWAALDGACEALPRAA
ncbi:MAG TPA: hypothetical protein VES39_04945 [Rhodospirillales bacterium]|nr:hypothetical protein [Rhodospirillales bacterium]